MGLAAHDLAVQALDGSTPLRPFVGICPNCRENRGWLKSRCSVCSRPVRRELAVVIATTSAAVAFANTVGSGYLLVPYIGFLGLTTALMLTDLDDFRIVDRLNLGGTVVLLVLLLVAALLTGQTSSMLRAVAGGGAYFVGSSLVFMAARGQGFGAGDVKLSFQLGLFAAFLSWGTLGWSVFATAMIGGVLALALVLGGRAGMKTELPYGPPMILGTWLAIALVGMGSIPIPS